MNMIYYELLQYALNIGLLKLKQIHENMQIYSSFDKDWKKVRDEFISVYIEFHEAPKSEKSDD